MIPAVQFMTNGLSCCSNAEVEEQIAHLRAELLHKEQENMCVQLQLQQEVQQRERAQKKVTAAMHLFTQSPNFTVYADRPAYPELAETS